MYVLVWEYTRNTKVFKVSEANERLQVINELNFYNSTLSIHWIHMQYGYGYVLSNIYHNGARSKKTEVNIS